MTEFKRPLLIMKPYYCRFHVELTVHDCFIKAHSKNEAREKVKKEYGATQIIQLKEMEQ